MREHKKFPAHEVILSHIEKHIAKIREYATNDVLPDRDKIVFSVLELHAIHELGEVFGEMILPDEVRSTIDDRFRLIEQSANIDALRIHAPEQHQSLCDFLHILHLQLLHPELSEETTIVISDTTGEPEGTAAADGSPIKRDGGFPPHPNRRD